MPRSGPEIGIRTKLSCPIPDTQIARSTEVCTSAEQYIRNLAAPDSPTLLPCQSKARSRIVSTAASVAEEAES